MSPQIAPFAEEQLDPAAGLIVDHYQRLVRRDPALPAQWLDRQARAGDITAALSAGAGVVALEGRAVVGFMIASLDLGGPAPLSGWPSEASLGGERSATIGIGRHAASAPEARAIYRAMYQALARQLVGRGCFRHSVSVAVVDQEAVDTMFGLGFGVDQILGARELAPLTNPRPDLTVRRARPTDVEALVALDFAGLRHHADSPVFLPTHFAPEPVRRDLLEAMQHPQRALWLAERDGEILGTMEITGLRRASINSARSESAITIGLASVREGSRSQGVGSAMLAHVFDWARGEGCTRCTVGWTSANIVSDRFWRGRSFAPVHHTLTRRIDERIAAGVQ